MLNSGLEMKYNMAGVHCVLDDKDNLVIDPEYITDEALGFSRTQKLKRNNRYKADFTFVFDSVQENVISVTTNGNFTIQQYNEAQKLCKQASRKVFDFYIDLAKKYSSVL